MSMPLSAEHLRSLRRFDLQVLLSIERGMKFHEWVPLDHIRASTGLSPSELKYRLGRLMEMGMVRYNPVPAESYTLVFNGYDALALHALIGRKTLHALGPQMGVGKESVVYEGLGLGPLVLKLHRVGQRSFQTPRLKRGYLPERGHLPRIFASAYSAGREYRALRLLHPEVSVPLPIDRNRHVIAMSLVEGAPLHRCRLRDPEETLQRIIREVRAAYRKGAVHADLSEFNVMSDGEKVFLIDWPQWVERGHPEAGVLLRRDLENILIYFRRKYGIEAGVEALLAEVRG